LRIAKSRSSTCAAAHDELRGEIDAAVARVVESGWYLLGPELEAFEAEFAGYCGTRHCVGVGSGLSALELALQAAGIARKHDLAVFEDAAQAHGARHQGRRAGGLGTAAAFSFYPTKNLGAFGDGGAVTTDDDEIADRVRVLRNYGQRDRYSIETAGVNSRLAGTLAPSI
jgi:dTDP-4-amino-4,6-dideoxygalactose transaminase